MEGMRTMRAEEVVAERGKGVGKKSRVAGFNE